MTSFNNCSMNIQWVSMLKKNQKIRISKQIKYAIVGREMKLRKIINESI
jgi:hypothetical protein